MPDPRINELDQLAMNDADVRLMTTTVILAEGVGSLSELAAAKPEVFAALYDEITMMVLQIEESG